MSIYIYYIWVICQYIYTTWMLDAHGHQRRALDPRELKLEMVVSCHAALGIKSESSRKAARAVDGWAFSPAPLQSIFIYPLFIYLGVCMHTHIPWHTCDGQRATCRSCFFLSTMWFPEVKLRSAGLAASAFTHWAMCGPQFCCKYTSRLITEQRQAQ